MIKSSIALYTFFHCGLNVIFNGRPILLYGIISTIGQIFFTEFPYRLPVSLGKQVDFSGSRFVIDQPDISGHHKHFIMVKNACTQDTFLNNKLLLVNKWQDFDHGT